MQEEWGGFPSSAFSPQTKAVKHHYLANIYCSTSMGHFPLALGVLWTLFVVLNGNQTIRNCGAPCLASVSLQCLLLPSNFHTKWCPLEADTTAPPTHSHFTYPEVTSLTTVVASLYNCMMRLQADRLCLLGGNPASFDLLASNL